jgi:hypothetical protein
VHQLEYKLLKKLRLGLKGHMDALQATRKESCGVSEGDEAGTTNNSSASGNTKEVLDLYESLKSIV